MESLIQTLIAAVSLPLGMWLLYRLFGKRFPYKPPPSQQHYTLEELKAKYERWDHLTMGLAVVFAPALIYVIYEAIQFFLDLRLKAYARASFVFVPGWEFWLLIALFLGVMASAIPLNVILQWRLRERFAEYMAYQNLLYRFDVQRVTRIAFTGFGGFLALCLAFLLDWYAAFGDSEIVVNLFLSFSEKRYAYSDIQRFTVEHHASSENPNKVEIWVTLYFKDGSSRDNVNLSPSSYEPNGTSLSEFIREQTGMAPSNWEDVSMTPEGK